MGTSQREKGRGGGRRCAVGYTETVYFLFRITGIVIIGTAYYTLLNVFKVLQLWECKNKDFNCRILMNLHVALEATSSS